MRNPSRSPVDPEAPHVPGIGTDRRGVDGHIGYLLRQAAGSFRLDMEHALADLEVTPPQFAILTMCRAYPGLSSADLARLAYLTPQTVTVIVANLEKAGLVVRQPHARHGRIRQLTLTPAGEARLAAARSRVTERETAILAGLSAEHEAIVRRWLVAVADRTANTEEA